MKMGGFFLVVTVAMWSKLEIQDLCLYIHEGPALCW